MPSALLEKLIHLRNFVQDGKSAPYNGRSWRPVMLTHTMVCCSIGNVLWQLLRSVGMAIERLPFNGLQQYFAA